MTTATLTPAPATSPTPLPTPDSAPSLEQMQAGFLALLPVIQRYAQGAFRHLRCPGKRDDAVAETVAVAWRWYVEAVQQGKDPAEFVTTLASFAVRHARSGRRLCGQERAKDVLSPRAQQHKGFVVQSLPEHDTGGPTNLALDALRDNTVTPPPDQAAFRIDFPLWMGSLPLRKRAVAEDLMLGERTQDVAGRHGMSAGRVSQIRSELLDSWEVFCA